MKTAWHLFVGLLLLHLIAAVAFVGWMYMDGRINKERLQGMVDTFSLTIDEEAAQAAEAQMLTEQAQQVAEQAARLEAVAEGPTTLRDRLADDQRASETSRIKIGFINAQNKALREEMARFKADHAQRVEQLETDREGFEQQVKQRAEQAEDANFQQVVELYETQPAKQTKQAFQSLMQQGKTDQVVAYLAAMSSRKAGKVLSQFKSPEEIPQAADLLERLRDRDAYSLDQQTPPPGNPS